MTTRGFTLVELLIALGLTLGVLASVVQLLLPAEGRADVEPEIADMHQRLRVAQHAIAKDLVMAGAGIAFGSPSARGPLYRSLPAVLPYRQGAIDSDAPGAFRSDTITLIYVPPTSAQGVLAAPLSGGDQAIDFQSQTACPGSSGLCRFSAGDTLLVFDTVGHFDTFKIGAVAGTAGAIRINRPPDRATATYAAGSTIARAVQRTYYLKADSRSDRFQLMAYDGSSNADVPAVDHVVGLTFDYAGDPRPPRMRNLASTTTYGPPPPEPADRPTAYPPGENCVFQMDPVTESWLSRLPVLGGSEAWALVPLTREQLTDGPWCPDESDVNRWDADLLRIRSVTVTVRVEAAIAALRGPAGLLFTRSGTSTGGHRWAPDLVLRFRVAPRNLNFDR